MTLVVIGGLGSNATHDKARAGQGGHHETLPRYDWCIEQPTLSMGMRNKRAPDWGIDCEPLSHFLWLAHSHKPTQSMGMRNNKRAPDWCINHSQLSPFLWLVHWQTNTSAWTETRGLLIGHNCHSLTRIGALIANRNQASTIATGKPTLTTQF